MKNDVFYYERIKKYLRKIIIKIIVPSIAKFKGYHWNLSIMTMDIVKNVDSIFL